MATRLAAIIRNSLNDDDFLLLKQTPPPKFGDDEYDSYVDSDIWDLPSTQLSLLEGRSTSTISIQGQELCSDKLNLNIFDFNLSLNQVLTQTGLLTLTGVEWKFYMLVEEPEFGPGLPLQTVFITGRLAPGNEDFEGLCKWVSIQSCLSSLLQVEPGSERVGPLVVTGLLNHTIKSGMWKVPNTLNFQEYPPGVKVIPMKSRTGKPFHTTNLVVFAPDRVPHMSGDNGFVASGDALIVDPGCLTQFHEQLQEIIVSLPRKLLVFITHHHNDHVDGLSVIQKNNPDAILLAHENTMQRIKKDSWSNGYTKVTGDDEICVGDQRLKAIFAPGHTDGHMALLHKSTHSLIVGDHCVGQGSAVLDVTSGGNMSEYFETTYKFMQISPHVLIPMHGRLNLWPKQMLCSYLKNRRGRETTILEAIEDGARTLFDIVAYTYAEVDRSVWIFAASNVRLHVDYLAQQNRLPTDFSLETFKSSITSFGDMVGKN
ncbi:uncharacterized protein LOC124915292 isoform X2 [Impatiens glandulifera]|uniref:uncharacterized protein LOC124915292 isoform X2 n=1 Tax=Impatiens glandulifera TaxID=253017 RepID=UPI001FB053F6|nr:uncharacterized protein LOC124915292 isoform X2 [Impatiens glandulifera]